MTYTARLALTVLCFVVAAGAELTGVVLVVAEVRNVSRTLRRWRDAGPEGEGREDRPHAELQRLVTGLLGSSFDRASAAAFLLVGIVTGAVGNVLSIGL